MNLPLSKEQGSISFRKQVLQERKNVNRTSQNRTGRLNIVAVQSNKPKKRDIFHQFEIWRRDIRIQWRRKRFEWIDYTEERKRRWRESEFVNFYEQVLDVLRVKMDPLFELRDWILLRLIDYFEGFHTFIMDEAKHEWRWSSRYDLEIAFWKKSLLYFKHMIMTIMYLTFIPPSFVRGIFVPLFVGWCMYDRLWTSPQAITVILTAPLRYGAGAGTCLFF